MNEHSHNPWAEELDDCIRAASGGFLFGIPLLYTMEVWWIGGHSEPARMLAGLVVTFGAVFLINYSCGFRRQATTSVSQNLIETTQALAISIICAAVALVVLRQLTLATPPKAALGIIVFEALPFAFGVAIANQLLSGDRFGNDDQQDAEGQADRPASPPAESAKQSQGRNETLNDLGSATIGAIFVALAIAPTEEVPMLAASISPPWLIGLVLFSLLVTYGIVFEAEFADHQSRRQQTGLLQHPLAETIAAYLVSLAVAAAMLWFFKQLSLADPWQIWLEHTLVLGLPAAIGGAAGRIAI